MKKLFLTIAIIFFFASNSDAITIRGSEKDVEAKLERIQGGEYVPLLSMCEAYGLEWQWDGIGRVVILEKNGVEITLKIGSSKIYSKNGFEHLNCPVEVSDEGAVLVPVNFSGKLSRLFKSPYVEKPQVAKPVKRKSPSKKEYEGEYKIRKIVIDAGHGGKDPGANRIGIKEKNVTLDIAERLADKLRDAGIEVVLTRDTDVFIPLAGRAEIANNEKADFFISIHANASTAKYLRGFEVYYLSEALDDSARALETSENEALQFEEKSIENHTKDLDATLWDLVLTENRTESIELAKSICDVAEKSLATPNRGVKCARFYVLKGAKIPAILIEVGYISNSKEASKIKKGDYRDKLADTIAEGVLRYKDEYERTNGFTN